MNDPAPVLEMQDVSKSFAAPGGRVQVLRNVNLSVSQGEFVAITGPSGSGKSTFLHLVALLDHPTSGTVLFDGQDVSTLREPDLCEIRKQKVGMVFQKYCLLPHRSVHGNVLFRFRYLDNNRADAERQAVQALEIMGLTNIANRPVRLLSGGEMQRVAIARAIALRPRLLLADEPTGNMDWVSANTVMECFRRLNQSGITIVMVTHNDSLLSFCTRHLVCQAGSIES
ncbi:MAG: ABC transporter ATP-binding protein [Gammaproteobacteria bacterium]|nr:ABC transporter ATP-binding protein [Gammaproteobacteria bacterium]